MPQQLRQLGYVRCDASRLVARETSPFRSQTWFSFFNGRYASPAALPITAPFFFETETAGLMFVRHRWPQSFLWWLFCRLPREDAAADYECAYDCPENPKLHLLHCGVLRRVTPPRAIIDRPAHQVLRNSSGSLAIFAAIRHVRLLLHLLRQAFPEFPNREGRRQHGGLLFASLLSRLPQQLGQLGELFAAIRRAPSLLSSLAAVICAPTDGRDDVRQIGGKLGPRSWSLSFLANIALI